MMKHYNYIIVGQGLAGSLLAYFLRKNNQKCLIIDGSTEGVTTASKIAAGVINPITGRRFVKSARIDELLPVAKHTYQEIEKILNCRLWHDRPIVRTLKDAEEENNWLLRKTYPDYQAYCGDVNATLPHHLFKQFPSFAHIHSGAQVNIPLLIERFHAFFTENELLINEKCDFDKLHIHAQGITYDGITADKIIFAEGANGLTNPYFKTLPFNVDKGELLLVRIPNLHFTGILKHKISIVPLHDVQNTEGVTSTDLYWVGATNTWTFDDDLPTETYKTLIINELKEILNTEFDIIAHQAAIRPTVKDRRPFIGFHVEYPQLAIFNGFGTKGASLVPYWAKHFTDTLIHQTPLDIEVDIKRFNVPPIGNWRVTPR